MGEHLLLKRILICLAVVIGFGFLAKAAWASEAGDLLEQGRKLLSAGQPLEALSKLERAAELKAGSGRYQAALRDAKEAVLDYSIRQAEVLGIDRFNELIFLAQTCERIAPADARTGAIKNSLSKLRMTSESEIAAAAASARSGALDDAKKVLARFSAIELDFPSILTVKEEVAFRESLDSARSLADRFLFKDALDSLAAWQSKRAGNIDFAATEQYVADKLVARIGPVLSAKMDSGQLSDLGLAAYALDQVEQMCSRCKGRLGDLALIQERFERGMRAILDDNSNAKSAAAKWAACVLATEAGSVLPRKREQLAAEYCTTGFRPRFGLALDMESRCLLSELPAALGEAFPYVEIVPVSFGQGGGANRDVEIIAEIELPHCEVGGLGDKDVQSLTSSWRKGTQQLQNPDYVEIQNQLNVADRERWRLQQAVQANPQDLGSSIALTGILVRVAYLTKQLRNVSPFLELPIEEPYIYERFSSGIQGSIEGSVEIFDAASPDTRFVAPVEVAEQRWAPGVRGVVPQDTQGLSNSPPELLPPVGMAILTGEKAKKLIVAAVQAGLPIIYAEKAHRALASDDAFTGLGYLALLRSSEIAEDDPDLIAYRKEHLANILSVVESPKGHASRLEPFLKRLATKPKSGLAPAIQAGKNVLEAALEAVVVVEQGQGSGSGFLVTADGLVLTNAHVIDDQGPIEVKTVDGDSFLATVVDQRPERDLALLRIRAQNLAYLKLGSIDAAGLGDDVYALGAPEGLRGTVTKGIVSAKRKADGVRYLQIDAPINPGNSGGPLILPNGLVIGVNTFKLSNSEGLNFSVAIDEAQAMLNPYLTDSGRDPTRRSTVDPRQDW
jgi:S1-C subfamily serine protease